MSVILDALHKARRDSTRDPSGAGGADTRALEGTHRGPEPRGMARRGLLVMVVLGSVMVTVAVCAGAFYLLALRMGVIPPGWPVTAFSSPAGAAATPAAQVLGADGNVVLVGAPTELPGWNGGAATGAPAGSAPGAMPTSAAPAASVATVSANGPLPTPAPLSAAAGGMGTAAGSPAILPPPSDLPIMVQQPLQGVQPVASGTVPAIAAAAPAAKPAVKVGTILCDETGCTAAVNGRTVRVGDVVLDYTVMAITADQLTLQRVGESPMVLRPGM